MQRKALIDVFGSDEGWRVVQHGKDSMIEAFHHGKLSRDQENMEDLLTSSVFGLLKHANQNEGLLPFLSQAEDLNGRRPLEWLTRDAHTLQSTYEFWPWWCEADCHGCEPDLVLRIDSSADKALLIAIEAKYLSGKSSQADETSIAPYDQLARQWDNLHRIAAREKREPFLIYLTADIGCPAEEVEASIGDFRRRSSIEVPRIVWLSWRTLSLLPANNSIIDDVKRLLRRMRLTPFQGVRPMDAPIEISWTLSYRTRLAEPLSLDWRFKR
jgi:hypothetical protein